MPPKPRVHMLKCINPFYADMVAGIKDFEIRLNDRDYRVGDFLWLRLYYPDQDRFAGPQCMVKVASITTAKAPHLRQYIVMGVKRLKWDGRIANMRNCVEAPK